jgi:hypothetical protein
MFIKTLAHILLLTLVVFWLHRREEKGVLKKFFLPGLLFKIMGGLCLGWIYRYYYHVGDTLSYFQDGTRLADWATTDAHSFLSFLWNSNQDYPVFDQLHLQEPRALFLSKVTALLVLSGAGHYELISIYFSLFSFASTWYIVKTISRFYPHLKREAVVAFLFFPSCVFWSAGLIKESISMMGLFFIAAFILHVVHRTRLSIGHWLFFIFSLWIVWSLKYYYLAVFLPIGITTIVVARFVLPRLPMMNLGWLVLIWLVIFIVPLYIASLLHPNFYPEQFLEVIVSNYRAFISISSPGDVILYNDLEATPASIFIHAPWALISGLYRPFPWEAGTIFQGIIALENIILIVLSLSVWWQKRQRISSADQLVLMSIVLYIILLCIFLALSTPNFGTLSRYRVGFLPFFVFLISCGNPVFKTLCSYAETTWRRLVLK